MPHTIRLRGPWEYQPLARATLLADGSLSLVSGNLPPSGTLVMPGDWGAALGPDFRGLVRFTRRFAQPTGLDASSRVWLALDNVDWQATVSLNGHVLGHVQLANTAPLSVSPSLHLSVSPSPPLPLSPSAPPAAPCPARFDITRLLQPRSVLTIDVLLPQVAAGAPPLARPSRESEPGGLIGLVRLEIEST